jgi:hypothetical protein
VKSGLWDATESAFYESIFHVLDVPDDVDATISEIRRGFQKALLARAEEIFDAFVDADAGQPEQLRRAVVARFDLVMTLTGNGNQGEKLFKALGLAAPKTKRSRTAARRDAEEASA